MPSILLPLLTSAVVVVVGFTACAEFGSYAFVHPVVRRLPHAENVMVEQGFTRTFGRVMPALMIGSMLLLVGWASVAGEVPLWLRVVAVAPWIVAVITTVSVNVGINAKTSAETHDDPAAWLAMRRRWDRFQGLRSWLFLASFVAIGAGAAW